MEVLGILIWVIGTCIMLMSTIKELFVIGILLSAIGLRVYVGDKV